MKKKLVSIVAVVALAVSVVFTIQSKMQSRQGTGVPSEQQITTAVDKKSGDEKMVLNQSYFKQMNELFEVTNSIVTDDRRYSIRVTDAIYTRSISEYSSKLSSPYYYDDDLLKYVNEDGTYNEGAYYIVVKLELTNTGEGAMEILVPGSFRLYFLEGNTVESGSNFKNQPTWELTRGLIVGGSGNLSDKGYLLLEQNQSSSVILITSRT